MFVVEQASPLAMQVRLAVQAGAAEVEVFAEELEAEEAAAKKVSLLCGPERARVANATRTIKATMKMFLFIFFFPKGFFFCF